ncbi:MAG: TetR family transcriptional regulator [Cyclobacteriaceae bacterium]
MAKKLTKTKKKEKLDLSTEEKIKKAALMLFTKKGFAATRTRDISEEAGINLALLNYYFRSKAKLFELVMVEILQNFFRGIAGIFNEENTTFEEKVKIFVENYTDLLKQQPDLPLFIFQEVRMNPERLVSKVGLDEMFKSFFFKQLQHGIEAKKIIAIHPLHYVINLIGMCVFPFIAAPVLKHLAGIDPRAFEALMEERKVLVPQWMKVIMEHNR